MLVPARLALTVLPARLASLQWLAINRIHHERV